MTRSFHHAQFPLDMLLERKRATVSVVLPAREVADTVGPIVKRVLSLSGLADQVLVVDAASSDGTADVAAAAGAEVRQEAELLPQLGPVLGKGDAMWRALAAVQGEIVIYLDSDTRDFDPAFVVGLAGTLIAEERVRFVKASYRRPFTVGDKELPDGGGRVSQLTAHPLLSAFYPDLADLAQPLAGEIAAPRDVLARVPFAIGYGVEMAMLIDMLALVGVDAIAQVEVGERRNFHQPLAALRPMSETVLAVVCERLRREGRLVGPGPAAPPPDRPPFASLSVA